MERKKETVRKKKGTGYITLYTLPYCLHCRVLKSTLDKMEVPYIDINIDENEKLGDILEKEFQTTSWPIIQYFKKPDFPTITIVPGTSLATLENVRIFTTIEQALEILLNYYYEI